MMNLNKKELKIMMYEFNNISNRVLRTSFNEFIPVLNKFINYIENKELIKEYVIECKRENFKVEEALNEIKSGYGRQILDLGTTEEEEVYTIYNFLKNISKNGFDPYTLGRAYSFESRYDDIIKDFNNKISLILIQNIISFLTKIGIEMGYDEEVRYMITNNGGQVNISKDMSTLNAVQNINMESEELSRLVTEIKDVLENSNITDEEKDEIKDSVETIQNELQSLEPKKGLIRTCMKGLQNCIMGIPTAIELCTNIKQFIEFVAMEIK